MKDDVKKYIESFPSDIVEMFICLKDLIHKSISCQIQEKLWAKIPSYYVEERFIRLIPFKNHINIEATAIINHKDELNGYKLTPKGMLQIYENEMVPEDVLIKIFNETLEC